jgi:hypothetical protein
MFEDYRSPERRQINGASVQVFSAPIVTGPPHGFRGGVVLGDGQGDSRLRHSRYWKAVDSFRLAPTSSEVVKGAYTYWGPYYEHFGHMMAEFVHRVIPSMNFDFPKNYILIGDVNLPRSKDIKPPHYFRDILYFLDINFDDILIINNDATVERLFICEQGSDFGGGPKFGYLDHLDRFSGPRLEYLMGAPWSMRKVYVSRSKVRAGGNYLGENYVESLLRSEGFDIFYPEECGLVDQMQVYRSADTLVFSEGSSCHGIEFFGNKSLNDCHMIERRASHREIFARIFKGRAKKYSIMTGAIELPTIVLDKTSGAKLDFLSNTFIPRRRLIRYLRDYGISPISEFSADIYYQEIMKDFDTHVSHHVNGGGRVLDAINIREIRTALQALIDIDKMGGQEGG